MKNETTRLAKVMVSTGEVVSVIDGNKAIADRHNSRMRSENERGHSMRKAVYYVNPYDYQPSLVTGIYIPVVL